MELEQARKRAEELRVIIERNNRLYYDQDAPELEDFEYDALTRELKALEAEYKDNKDIVFMGISVDASKNIQKWKDFVIKEQLPGVQLFGGDMAGPTLSKPYKITGIPRFMLVGKDGSLIYMDAPRPSSSEIRAVLNDALKK